MNNNVFKAAACGVSGLLVTLGMGVAVVVAVAACLGLFMLFNSAGAYLAAFIPAWADPVLSTAWLGIKLLFVAAIAVGLCLMAISIVIEVWQEYMRGLTLRAVHGALAGIGTAAWRDWLTVSLLHKVLVVVLALGLSAFYGWWDVRFNPHSHSVGWLRTMVAMLLMQVIASWLMTGIWNMLDRRGLPSKGQRFWAVFGLMYLPIGLLVMVHSLAFYAGLLAIPFLLGVLYRCEENLFELAARKFGKTTG